MKLKTIILLILIPVLTLNFSNLLKRLIRNYLDIYIQKPRLDFSGLPNTNSCNSVDYKISKDGNGKLSGYGIPKTVNGLILIQILAEQILILTARFRLGILTNGIGLILILQKLFHPTTCKRKLLQQKMWQTVMTYLMQAQ